MTTTTTLLERLTVGPGRRDRILDDCVRMIDEEVSAKSGLMALPLKAGYKVVKGLRPGFIRAAMDFLLDDFCRALEPFYRAWADRPPEGRPALADALRNEQDRVADALLSITDARAARSTHTTVRSLYEKLRGAAKGHVVAALPRLGRTIEPYLR
ncbi:MAG: hypothetical protein M9894_24765 [Planctomycetes bacterium]|nr:hypothetical protein [Planctomycetota bacterium]